MIRLSENAIKNKLAKAALAYVSRFGWAVLPLHSIKDRHCTCGKLDCGSAGKHPLTKNGVSDASKDLGIVARWWQKWPFANIGVATGSASGFFVLDIDGEAGEDSLRALEEKHAKLPSTVEQITGGGGRHLLFKCLGSATNKVALAPGLDIRGSGGYIVAPPSVHISGRRYEWELSSRPGEVAIAEAPMWLLDMIGPQGTDTKAAKSVSEWQRLACTYAPEGERNQRLTSIVGHLLRSHVNPYLAQELALAWNARRCRPPLNEAEVLRIVESVAAAELRRTTGRRG